MKTLSLSLIFLLGPIVGFAQETLLSIGYGKTFVSADSSTLSLTLDVNRIPGNPEKGGGYYFLNSSFGASRWGYYLMPMVDANIGTAVSSAPNNIAVGLPVGFVYDVEGIKLDFHLDLGPEFVADKMFNNNLFYFNTGAYLRFANKKGPSNFSFSLVTGIFNANGTRYQKGQSDKSYGRLTFPLHIKTAFWSDSSAHFQKTFNRFALTNTFKFNHIYQDDRTISPKIDYIFFNSRLDFYINPKLAINVSYINGYEEPVFKNSHALTFGFTYSR